MLSTFEDLVNACLGSGKHFHLLYVYMKTAAMPAGDVGQALFPGQDVAGLDNLCTIQFDAHEPVKPGLTFAEMVSHADSYCPDWDVVFVQTARNRSNAPVSDEQAKIFLADMREKILSGNFPQGAPIFDKQGNLKGIQRSAPIRVNDSTHRAQ
ncbi:hypothetical protein GM415_07295 [Pseudodesulfovibrio cashew]|uniref:Uncharacterized protein n=1 Tax=Pseudodesulfovibrio cashew TaxID=2678688 RepID=A0A6I6JID7_9BACT|nr:hypothetical protein [Pseudodesulfovibrio cashew]QGY39937.1 hypothetical protein GM415_07295 [Pseudodesulfovibrio cashew]